MNSQLIIVYSVFSTAVAIAVIMFGYAWRRRPSLPAESFMLMLLGLIIWLVTAIVEMSVTTAAAKMFWVNAQYFGVVIVPVAGFLFSAAYTGRTAWFTRRNMILLFVVPVLIIVLVWTNPWHQLFRLYFRLNSSVAVPVIETAMGPAFWLHTAYSYVLMAWGIGMLVQAFFQAQHLYKRQIGLALIGVLGPIATNVVYVVLLANSQSPPLFMDPTPLGFLFTSIMFGWAAFGYQLIDVVPVARTRIVEKMRDGIVVLDAQNRIVDINVAAREMVGIAPDAEVIGQPAGTFIQQWPELAAKYSDATTANVDIALPQNGTEAYYRLNISAVYDERDQLSARLIMLSDVTTQKNAELALREAKQAAETSSRAKSAFLAAMSHELRTPLAAIIGYSELIQEQNIEPEQKATGRRVAQIETAAHHLLRLINDILDMSKIEAGRMDLHNVDFSVYELLEALIYEFEPRAAANGNRFEVDIDPHIGMMVADATRMRQILRNLLDNACKFTQGGEVLLTAVRLPRTAVPDLIQFQIRDTGPGISAQKIETAFEPFTQTETERSKESEGSGLGLAIGHRLCRMMGGEIVIESEPDRGTAVTVTLPSGCDTPPPNLAKAAMIPERETA